MLVAAALLSLLLTACGEESGEPEAGAAGARTTTSSPQSTTIDTANTESDLPAESQLIEDAVADLVARLGVQPDAVTVVSSRSVVWPDTSLGCPQEGEMYAQVTVPGAQVLLGARERVYDYHAGDDDSVFLCPSGEKDGGYDFVPPPGDDEK